MKSIIIGSKGRKKKKTSTRAPVEEPNTLQSKQIARVIDLLCEGEIQGLVNGAKSIYLDETPIQNEDGSYNFEGVTIHTVNGSQDQNHIPGFPGAENEVIVNTQVEQATPIVRSITDTNVDRLRVTVFVPALYQQDSKTGDIKKTTLQFAIDVNNNGAGWVVAKTVTLNDKTMSQWFGSYVISLPDPGPWDVRVRRITADSGSANLANGLYWYSYTEIIDAKLAHPNCALVGVEIDASYFDSIPQRAYHVKLKNDVKIPSNYDPVARTYTGEWDGTFKLGWTNNPAWIFYDLLTNDRYGLGEYIDSSYVDKWSLYQVAKYCDELVPDGSGGYEPRYTCNVYIQSREEALQVLQNIAAICHGFVHYQAGLLSIACDRPQAPVKLFTNANVKDGVFQYEQSSLSELVSVVHVIWNDPQDFYRQTVETVVDADLLSRFGYRDKTIQAIGCTSRGQARRYGRM